jgi:hypothetical protein
MKETSSKIVWMRMMAMVWLFQWCSSMANNEEYNEYTQC